MVKRGDERMEMKIGRRIFRKIGEEVWEDGEGNKIFGIENPERLELEPGLWVQRADGAVLFLKKKKPYSLSTDFFVFYTEVSRPYEIPWEADTLSFVTSYAVVIDRFLSKKCMGNTHFLSSY